LGLGVEGAFDPDHLENAGCGRTTPWGRGEMASLMSRPSGKFVSCAVEAGDRTVEVKVIDPAKLRVVVNDS